MNLGSFNIDDVLTFCGNTHNDAGPVDADSAPSYRVYEDETGTPLLTGSMATLDASNTDGFYSEQITLSTANGFEYGKCYSIRKLATVSGVSGVEIDTFQVGAKVDVRVWDGTAVATPATAGYPAVTHKVGTGTGELSIASGVVSANAVQLSGDATAADNAERFFDGTGYANLMIRTTIASLTSQTILVLTDGSAEDDTYNSREVIIRDQSTAVQIFRTTVSDYAGGTKTLTLAATPSFTIATGDFVEIQAGGAGSSGGGNTLIAKSDAIRATS